jgi:dolichol-phosphate mannosyltransferase
VRRSLLSHLSLVIPVYNEEANLNQLYEKLRDILDQRRIAFRILFVNDGSRDGSLPLLRRLAASDSRIRVLSFSRNFGHQAISAGTGPPTVTTGP